MDRKELNISIITRFLEKTRKLYVFKDSFGAA